MAHQRIPRATKFPNAVMLEFPYAPDLIAAIKRDFPSYCRSYAPTSHVWAVKEPHTDRAIRLLRQFFPGAEIVTAGAQHTPPPHRPEPLARPDHYALLHVLPSAPPEVVRAAFVALVKKNHPDALPAPERGRAHTTMIALNAAIEALRAEGRA